MYVGLLDASVVNSVVNYAILYSKKKNGSVSIPNVSQKLSFHIHWVIRIL